jgi:hypothetical protein
MATECDVEASICNGQEEFKDDLKWDQYQVGLVSDMAIPSKVEELLPCSVLSTSTMITSIAFCRWISFELNMTYLP